MTAKLGIRLEDKNEWETRVPLVPEDVGKLVADGLDIRVQRFPRRVFPDAEYEQAGAALVDDIADCDLVLGVKEIPPALFRELGAYMFFSHTIKGQRRNMKMLARLVEQRCTLLDYETVTDDNGRRLIFFGHYAGLAGMVDTLWTLGKRLEALGYESPLQDLRQCHTYGRLDRAKQAIKAVGKRIADEGLPDIISPCVIGVTGYGNVSRGAQAILSELPVVEVAPEDLADFVRDNPGMNDRFVKVVYKEEHLVAHRDPERQFDLQEYYDNGADFESRFGPHLELITVLVNAIFWNEQYPRLATTEQLRELFGRNRPPRLLVVGDISCDVDGALQCTVRDTGPGDPVYVYNPATGETPSGFEGPGLAVMAVSNLPCELPVGASRHFSDALTQYMKAMAAVDWSGAAWDQVDLPAPIKRSVILWQGEFTETYKYMEKFLADGLAVAVGETPGRG